MAKRKLVVMAEEEDLNIKATATTTPTAPAEAMTPKVDNINILQKMSQRIEKEYGKHRTLSTKHSSKREADTESVWTKHAFEMAEQDKHD